MKDRLKRAWRLLKEAGQGMSNDQVPMMGAALAYYTMFSIAPLLIIAIGVAGVVFGDKASVEVFGSIKSMIGPQGASAIQGMVRAASSRPQAGLVATIVGVVTLIAGASGVFSQLQQSLNIIWKVTPKPTAGWWLLIRQRLVSFGMVAAIGFVLLVSMFVSAGLAAAGQWAVGLLPGSKILWNAVNILVSLAIISLLFSAILKVLPDVKLSWRDVRLGGFVTAALFVIGKAAIGAYIGRSGVSTSYGAAGSLIVVLLWVFYSSQILYFGAEFTRAHVLERGRPIETKEGAMIAMTPINAASIAMTQAEAGKLTPMPAGEAAVPEAQVPARAWAAGAGAGLAVAAALLLVRHRRVAVRLSGAAFVGSLASLLSAVLAARLISPEESEPSTAAKLVGKIPTRVKLAAAGGAIKGGGKEAAREIKENVREKAAA